MPDENTPEVDDADLPGPVLHTQGPDPERAPSAHIVLGYAEGEHSDTILGLAADLATRLNATLHVVHIVDLTDYPLSSDDPDWDRKAAEHLAQEQRDVQTALAASPTSWTYHAAHGSPVALLRQVADDCDAMMFVVGSRGEGAGSIASRLLGRPSVSHGLIAHTHRPVLVVPPRAHRPAATH
ncbi:universal stress protein [Actinomycetospora endophytica]|uniref:Universal stress protein n=1 Tax=Actinomycetospora endophytica TaxID=2291215 RepID=A0ABS8PGE9_9PSEU|nr:universal stress protein [Actinomycetospora endophytica]MCD2197341.1 universal stress protein [Actinomycetospora endophytica]